MGLWQQRVMAGPQGGAGQSLLHRFGQKKHDSQRTELWLLHLNCPDVRSVGQQKNERFEGPSTAARVYRDTTGESIALVNIANARPEGCWSHRINHEAKGSRGKMLACTS